MLRELDDSAQSTLNSMVFFNNVDIVTSLAGDEDFLDALFEKLDCPGRGGAREEGRRERRRGKAALVLNGLWLPLRARAQMPSRATCSMSSC